MKGTSSASNESSNLHSFSLTKREHIICNPFCQRISQDYIRKIDAQQTLKLCLLNVYYFTFLSKGKLLTFPSESIVVYDLLL